MGSNYADRFPLGSQRNQMAEVLRGRYGVGSAFTASGRANGYREGRTEAGNLDPRLPQL
jgi:hypothetical protein